MRRLLHLVARLYPASWRARYGDEFHAVLDDVTPRWRDVLDVFRGGLTMRLVRSRIPVMAVTFGLVGGFVVWAAAFALVRDQFQSRALLTFQLPALPTLVTADTIEHRRASSLVDAIQTILSRKALEGIIERNNLYLSERGRQSMEDAVYLFKQHTTLRPMKSDGLTVSFDDPDPRVAQQVTEELVALFARAHDLVPGATVAVIETASLPEHPFGPNRIKIAGMGLGGGALLGVIVAFFWRRQSPAAA